MGEPVRLVEGVTQLAAVGSGAGSEVAGGVVGERLLASVRVDDLLQLVAGGVVVLGAVVAPVLLPGEARGVVPPLLEGDLLRLAQGADGLHQAVQAVIFVFRGVSQGIDKPRQVVAGKILERKYCFFF